MYCAENSLVFFVFISDQKKLKFMQIFTPVPELRDNWTRSMTMSYTQQTNPQHVSIHKWQKLGTQYLV